MNCEFRVFGTDEVIFIDSVKHFPSKNDFVTINTKRYKVVQVEFGFKTTRIDGEDDIAFYIEQA